MKKQIITKTLEEIEVEFDMNFPDLAIPNDRLVYCQSKVRKFLSEACQQYAAHKDKEIEELKDIIKFYEKSEDISFDYSKLKDVDTSNWF